MKHLIDAATSRAIWFNSDGATAEFYDKLKANQFQSTKCSDCGHIPFPPRPFCPKCGCESVDWVDIPTTGTLYAFSTQGRSLRFMAPDVLGIVELEGVGLVFSKINAPLEELEIGQTVTVEFLEVDEKITVHQFTPTT